MPKKSGSRKALSASRKFICDMMHMAKSVPIIPLERTMHLSELTEARKRLQHRPGWCAIFTKAFAIVADQHSVLRQAYMPYPWPQLYEHPDNLASISMERQIAGETGLVVGQFRKPEHQSLRQIDEHIETFKTKPVEEIAAFRRVLSLCRWPTFIRRLVWWWGLKSTGRRRARHFGTFGVSTVGGLGANLLMVRSPLTSVLTFGPVSKDGVVNVRVNFDHRVLDGAQVARYLEQMEEVLRTRILEEVLQLQDEDVLDQCA